MLVIPLRRWSLSTVEEARFEPMTIGSLLDQAFRLYAQNFFLMVGISAMVYVPLLLLEAVGTMAVPAESEDVSVAALAAGFIAFLGWVLTAMIVVPLATGATTKAVSECYLGRPVTVGAAIKAALSRIVPLLVTQLIVGIIVVFGLFLFIIPGVVWWLSYQLVAPVTVLETSDLTRIRQRSWELVRGNRLRVLVVMLVILGLQMVPTFFLVSFGGVAAAAGVELNQLLATVVDLVVGGLGGILLFPLGTIALTLLYYDFRIRKEGFDLEMLSQAIAAPVE